MTNGSLNIHPIDLLNLKPQLERVFRLRFAPMIWGPPGVGKSEVIADIAKNAIYYMREENGEVQYKLTFCIDSSLEESNWTRKQGIKLTTIHLSQCTAEDFIGYPGINEESKTSFIYPNKRLPNGENVFPGILFLDEIAAIMGDESKQAAVYQILLDRAAGEVKIPDTWVVVGAGNNPGTGAIGELPGSAAASRMVHYLVQPNSTSWLEWASSVDYPTNSFNKTPGIHPLFLTVVKVYPEIIDQYGNEDLDGFLQPTSRTIVRLNDLYLSYLEDKENKEDVEEFIADNLPTITGMLGIKFSSIVVKAMREIYSRPDLTLLLDKNIPVANKIKLLNSIKTMTTFWSLIYSLSVYVKTLTPNSKDFESNIYTVVDLLSLIKNNCSKFPAAESETTILNTMTSKFADQLALMAINTNNENFNALFSL